MGKMNEYKFLMQRKITDGKRTFEEFKPIISYQLTKGKAEKEIKSWLKNKWNKKGLGISKKYKILSSKVIYKGMKNGDSFLKKSKKNLSSKGYKFKRGKI